MAFGSTLSRSAARHISTYGSMLDRFLASSSSASTSSWSAASPFEPSKNAATGCWAPPKYSLRRQAKLVKQAALTGQLAMLPDGPKTMRVQKRLERLTHANALDEQCAQYQYVPTQAAQQSVRPSALGQRVVKPRLRVSHEEKQQALIAARQQVKGVGPYAGRAKTFKGSRVDKDKAKRSQDVKAKLLAMDQSVDEWHSTQSEAKNKLKPGLPF